jgi:uncharacterized sulfatase
MNPSKPNILWITLDSVRADHTSLHGYHRETTPEISRIAESDTGNKFKHGIAHSTRTPVSVPSMLTGLYPSNHQMIGVKSGHQIPESIKTVPELLSARGYKTIGVSENGYAGEAKGIDKRFDDFIHSNPSSVSDILSPQFGPSFVKYLLKIREHGPGLTVNKKAHAENKSYFTTDIAKRKLRSISRRSLPFFCYIHYNDPHHPYIPPLSHRDEYTVGLENTADEAVAFAKQMHDELYQWIADGVPLTESEWEMLHAMYDATIKYTDSCVGKLFDFVQDRFSNTIVVITADHGDLFGEYGLLGHHIVLHDGLIHVPMVTHGLDNVQHHVDHPTQHIDLMQTILSIVGADTTQFQGYDLREQSREIAISQDLRATVDDDEEQNYERIRQYNPDIDLSHLPASLVTAARTTDLKLVRTDEETRLYQLPDEDNDIHAERPDKHRELSIKLDNWLRETETASRADPKKKELTDELEEHLQDMGYI